MPGGGDINWFHKIISLENIFSAWREFLQGKRNKTDVQDFQISLEENILALYNDLRTGGYRHGPYKKFFVCDPKRRTIHKALVCDRLLHHAICRVLTPYFEKGFIFDSYSSRINKGVHKARRRFRKFARQLSGNNTKSVWVLQCDIRKFFDSVDHAVLKDILARKIQCSDTIGLLSGIIDSFETSVGRGMPIGNLTSQMFSNIYMNPFDHYIKRVLQVKYYIRYADDFVILSHDKDYLDWVLRRSREFLLSRLELEIHPEKVIFRKWHQGVDFLGAVSFPHGSVLRTRTRHRMMRRLSGKNKQSYLGLLTHVKGHRLKRIIMEDK